MPDPKKQPGQERLDGPHRAFRDSRMQKTGIDQFTGGEAAVLLTP